MSDEPVYRDGRVQVEALADDYFARRANGEGVTIADYAEMYPGQAEEILEVFPALEAMKSLSKEWKRTVVQPQQAGPDLPFRMGDYQLERKIGQGGMGIVYEAEHTSLRRRVAIKILKMFSLNTDSDIQRFHDEARAAARLHHTNIVPIFDFGEADGFHYIAMQLIQGDGLDVLVERFRKHNAETSPVEQQAISVAPLDHLSAGYWKDVARIGIQAANALAYAHSRGTIHRDVKPANLLLDQAGVVWVADFGLARQREDGTPTQSGVLSGTLRYLAPEHFDGKCDERSDQYGLGLALYELTTLQSVTGSSSRHAEIIRRITEAKVTAPRLLNDKIPRDLETIILKAISANPVNRFENCTSLAEELERFVEGRPILSRPVSRIEKLGRWAKRYPALATASTTSVVLLMLIAVMASVGYRAERKLRQRAEATSDYALEALDTVFDRYALHQQSAQLFDHTEKSSPVLSRESAQMLKGLLPIFDRLAALDEQSEEVHLRAIAARKRVGDIQQRLGQFEEAVASYQQAASRYQQLPNHSVGVLALRMSEIYNDIGKCELMLDRPDLARDSHLNALQQLESLPQPVSAEVTFQLARTHFLLTKRLRPGESLNGSEPTGPFRSFSPSPDFSPGKQTGGSGGRGRPPERRRPDGPPFDGIDPGTMQHLTAAIQLIESLDMSQQQDPRCRHLKALCLARTVPDRFSGRTFKQQESETIALSLLEGLAIENPTVPDYHHAYVVALGSLDTRHADSIFEEDLLAAESRLRHTVLKASELVANHPYVPDYTMTLIHSHNRLANLFERMAEQSSIDEWRRYLQWALEAYESAETLQRGLLKKFPEASSFEAWHREFEHSASRIRHQLESE